MIVPANMPHKFINDQEMPLRLTSVHPHLHIQQEDLE
jgi:mannose-6-phosphate isomerase-like protein (cupin superfamily)